MEPKEIAFLLVMLTVLLLILGVISLQFILACLRFGEVWLAARYLSRKVMVEWSLF